MLAALCQKMEVEVPQDGGNPEKAPPSVSESEVKSTFDSNKAQTYCSAKGSCAETRTPSVHAKPKPAIFFQPHKKVKRQHGGQATLTNLIHAEPNIVVMPPRSVSLTVTKEITI